MFICWSDTLYLCEGLNFRNSSEAVVNWRSVAGRSQGGDCTFFLRQISPVLADLHFHVRPQLQYQQIILSARISLLLFSECASFKIIIKQKIPWFQIPVSVWRSRLSGSGRWFRFAACKRSSWGWPCATARPWPGEARLGCQDWTASGGAPRPAPTSAESTRARGAPAPSWSAPTAPVTLSASANSLKDPNN